MNSQLRKLFASLIFLILITSCKFVSFSTVVYLPENAGKKFISPHEVSTGDWITYIVATSFDKSDTFINLSNHIDIISSKLPDLEIPGWSSYTIKAFLRKANEGNAQLVCNSCIKWCNGIYVSNTAWDSIEKYGLLEVPVVGITFEQAMAYTAYHQNILNNCTEPSKKNKNEYRYECFLPTSAQFDSVLTTIDSVNTKGCPRFNFRNNVCFDCPGAKKIEKHLVGQRSGREPVYVWAYSLDSLGLYNLRGNVAEMTSEKGIAKGGSCVHYASEATAGNSQEYSKPEQWLGFRIWYKVYPK